MNEELIQRIRAALDADMNGTGGRVVKVERAEFPPLPPNYDMLPEPGPDIVNLKVTFICWGMSLEEQERHDGLFVDARDANAAVDQARRQFAHSVEVVRYSATAGRECGLEYPLGPDEAASTRHLLIERMTAETLVATMGPGDARRFVDAELETYRRNGNRPFEGAMLESILGRVTITMTLDPAHPITDDDPTKPSWRANRITVEGQLPDTVIGQDGRRRDRAGRTDRDTTGEGQDQQDVRRHMGNRPGHRGGRRAARRRDPPDRRAEQIATRTPRRPSSRNSQEQQ